MVTLQIEHPVPDFDAWKKAFESDPMGRKKSGVKRYKISRQTNEMNNVLIELEFDNAAEAEALLLRLKKLWNQVEGIVMTGAKARIFELVETKEY